jgi:hypothetical protein
MILSRSGEISGLPPHIGPTLRDNSTRSGENIVLRKTALKYNITKNDGK